MTRLRGNAATLAAAVLVALLVVSLAGCSGTGDRSSSGSGYVSGSGTVTTVPADQRTSPGPVSGTTLSGRSLSLSDYAGRVVVVNVWGSWCPPCREEAPDLVAASRRLADQHVAFLGVNVRDFDTAAPRAFVRRYHVPYPSLHDPSGRTLLAFHGTLLPNSIPSTVVLDRRGRVAASVLGRVSTSTLVDMVHDVAHPQAHAGAAS